MYSMAESQTTTPVIKVPDGVQVASATPAVDPKAKAFTDKLMELIGSAYTLATELATIDDPQLLQHPAIRAARDVVMRVKELRRVLG